MKKVLLSLCLGLVIAQNAHAVPSCGSSLMPAFTANQATQLCKTFGSAVSQSLIPSADNTYDVGSTTFGWRTGYFDTSVITPLVSHATSLALGIAGTAEVTVTNDALTFSGAAASIVGGATSLTIGSAGSTIIDPANDAQRLITFSSSSDTIITQFFGDGGVTAAQTYRLGASTSDSDDDSTLTLGNLNQTRGGRIDVKGNEASGAGDVNIVSGVDSGSGIGLTVYSSDGTLDISTNNLLAWQVTGAGLLTNHTQNGGDLNLNKTGTTLAVQEATAGSACSGTLTANGATPVVTSTTCAKSTARIFLTRTSAETGVVSAWISAISDATSFSITGEAGDTGTYNWIIFHEAA